MNRLKYILTFSLIGFTFTGGAQNEADALRYSFLNHPSGTARSIAMGGAFGALGADFSGLHINPAGVGLYRKSEFGMTVGITDNNTRVSYLDQTNEQGKFNMNIGNMALVAASGTQNTSGWISSGFGISYQRMNDFHRNFTIRGENTTNSILNVYANMATGLTEEELRSNHSNGAVLAYDAYLIDPIGTTTDYIDRVGDSPVLQEKQIEERGRMGETSFSYGGNYENKVFMAISMNIPTVRFTQTNTYTETVLDTSLAIQNTVSSGSTSVLDNFEIIDDLQTRGNGFNLKAGVILMPNNWLRVGAAYHSPTWLSLTDDYSTNMSARFYNGSVESQASPQGFYEYSVKTPSRLIGSMALVLGKQGLISVDYERINYSNSKLSSNDGYPFLIENEEIRKQFRSTGNLRAGAEWRIRPFSFRIGAQMLENPYKSDFVQNDDPIMVYSGGLGIRDGVWYLDFAYSITQEKQDYYLYDPSIVQVTNVTSNRHQVLITGGIRF